MCKLFILSNVSKLTPKQLSRILKSSSQIMGKTDKDGFGWAMLNGNNFVGERCLEPEYFENRFFNNGTIPSQFKPRAVEYSGGLIVHARISTNTISLTNTHPFVNSDYALVHNGIVDNIGPAYEQRTTCDSEHALEHLTSGGIDSMVGGISGYYAIGALNRKTGELLVVKDNIANLNACYVPSIESMAFGTNADQLHQVLKAAELSHTKIKAVKDNVALVFNRKGELVSQSEIVPAQAPKVWNQRDYERSMGLGKSSSYLDELYEKYGDDYETRFHYADRAKSNVVPMHPSETVPLNDAERAIRAADDGAPITECDFVDAQGYPVPYYRLDSEFIFCTMDGIQMSAEEFLELGEAEQELVEVLERKTGEPVARKAG
jgi:predicted glutamine amidotransferase